MGLGFLNYAVINKNSRRLNPPARRISVAWSGHSLRQRCSNVQGGNSQFNGSKPSRFLLQAAFSQFSGNIYPIDLTGNRDLLPSGSVTAAAYEKVPEDLLEQLKPAGRLIMPLGSAEDQQLTLVIKDAAGSIRQQEVLPVRFTRLETVIIATQRAGCRISVNCV